MGRRLFTIASAVSLMLCLATVVLWASTDDIDYRLAYQADERYLFIGASYRQFVWGCAHTRESPHGWSFDAWQGSIGMMMIDFDGGLQRSHAVSWWWKWIPCAPIAATTAVLPAFSSILAVARFRRRQPGHCACCSYDLTANTSGVCPECGTVVRSLPIGSVSAE